MLKIFIGKQACTQTVVFCNFDFAG